ncbi:hypothetical protein AAC387_Pa04g2646 [Persea americana]
MVENSSAEEIFLSEIGRFSADHFLEDMSAEKVLLRDCLLSFVCPESPSIDPIPCRSPPFSSSIRSNTDDILHARREEDDDHCMLTTQREEREPMRDM